MPAIRLLVIDDAPSFRQRVRRIVNDSDRAVIVAEASDGAEALRLLLTHDVDLITLDIALGTENGLSLVPTLRAAYPRTPVLMLTNHAEWSLVAMRNGASGYLLKELVLDELIPAIDHILRGGPIRH